MYTTTFNEQTKEYLIGLRIIEVGDNYIVLDNGLRIYIEESEIEMTNR